MHRAGRYASAWAKSKELLLKETHAWEETIALTPALPPSAPAREPARSTHLQLGVLAAPHQALGEEEAGIAGPSERRLRNRGQSSLESSENDSESQHASRIQFVGGKERRLSCSLYKSLFCNKIYPY